MKAIAAVSFPGNIAELAQYGYRSTIDLFHRSMRAPLAACHEPAGKLWQLCKVLYVFEHKMQYLLIHAPYTLIVIFWHISNVCWFNFDALAQGNAYKPTKEPINYRGPGGDRTHDLQTEATPPAASCPARTLHATEIAPKNATPMTCPWLHWTTDNPSGMHRCQFQHLCVLILNCALALAIYIFVGLILMLWHRETHINPQRNR